MKDSHVDSLVKVLNNKEKKIEGSKIKFVMSTEIMTKLTDSLSI